MNLIMSDNDHERSELPRLVLYVLCLVDSYEKGRERQKGEGVKEGEKGRERGGESAKTGVYIIMSDRPHARSLHKVSLIFSLFFLEIRF